jgi:hypothetical protein
MLDAPVAVSKREHEYPAWVSVVVRLDVPGWVFVLQFRHFGDNTRVGITYLDELEGWQLRAASG